MVPWLPLLSCASSVSVKENPEIARERKKEGETERDRLRDRERQRETQRERDREREKERHRETQRNLTVSQYFRPVVKTGTKARKTLVTIK